MIDQMLSAPCIAFSLSNMNSSIYFNYQTMFGTVEVNDEVPQRVLAAELQPTQPAPT
jgi:hypothetical protein